jgi:hypothetical protein
MGCEDFSAKKFSRPFCRSVEAPERELAICMRSGDCSSAKLNLISDFLQ